MKEDKCEFKEKLIVNKKEEVMKNKRRQTKNKAVGTQDKKKFYIDYREEPEKLKLVNDLLKRANDKKFGQEVNFKDLVSVALKKLTNSDIEKVQKNTFKEMDRVLVQLENYNQKNKTNLNLGEYLVKQLKI